MLDIHTLTPETELLILQDYLDHWITNQWPQPRYPFKQYLLKHYPHLVPGTIPYAKLNATHCFYCDRPFGDKLKTMDHFYPVSKKLEIGPIRQIMIVCCLPCNASKSNEHPHNWLRGLSVAIMEGGQFMGRRGSLLKITHERASAIFLDEMVGIQQRVYWIQK